MMFLIEDITDRTGKTRTNGKYPKRKGSIVSFLNPVQIGEPIYFSFVKYNDGSFAEEEHVTRTSRVDDLEWNNNRFLIYTRNSIYEFLLLD